MALIPFVVVFLISSFGGLILDKTVSDPNFEGMAVFTPVINGKMILYVFQAERCHKMNCEFNWNFLFFFHSLDVVHGLETPMSLGLNLYCTDVYTAVCNYCAAIQCEFFIYSIDESKCI